MIEAPGPIDGSAPVSPADRACRFVAERIREHAGPRWLQARRRTPLSTSPAGEWSRLFAERRLCGVPELAASALVGWSDGRFRALLLESVPTVRQVLQTMTEGARCVSLLGPERQDRLAFALHDLCHLHKFFDPATHVGQVGFFRRLSRALDDPRWAEIERDLDERWHEDRDHVVSDMNGSALFLYCGLKSRLSQACRRAGVGCRLELLDRLLDVDGNEVVSRRSSPERLRQLLSCFESLDSASRIASMPEMSVSPSQIAGV